jgi:hypothetical protein
MPWLRERSTCKPSDMTAKRKGPSRIVIIGGGLILLLMVTKLLFRVDDQPEDSGEGRAGLIRQAELCDAYKQIAMALVAESSAFSAEDLDWRCVRSTMKASFRVDGPTAAARTFVQKWIDASIAAGRNPRIDEVNLSVWVWLRVKSPTGDEQVEKMSHAQYLWRADIVDAEP